MSREPSLRSFTEDLAAATPAPAGGAAAAATAALAAALATMVGRLALARAGGEGESRSGWEQLVEVAERQRERLLVLVEEDAAAYQAVMDVRSAEGLEPTAREAKLRGAWRRAIQIPAEVIRLSRDVAQLAHRAVREGPRSTVADAVMAALLAAAAAAGSQINLRLNVTAAGGSEDLRVLADQSEVLLREVQRAAADARMALEDRIRPSGSAGRPS